MFRKNREMAGAMKKAVETGNLAAVKKLIDKHAGDLGFLNAVDEYGNTALLKAIRYGKIDIAEFLLGCDGIDVDKEAWQDKFEPGKNYRCAPLNLAVHKGYIKIAKRILLKPAVNVNNYSFQAQTVMDTAILGHHIDIVRILLCHPKFDLRWLAIQENIFSWALQHLSRKSFNALVTQPDVKLDSVMTSSSEFLRSLTISHNMENTLALLLTLPDFDINMPLWQGNTLLTFTVKHGYYEIFSTALKHPKLDVNKVDASGASALLLAAGQGKMDFARALLGHEDIDDTEKVIALLRAAQQSHMDIVQLFLNDKNFNWQTKNRVGKNILMLAAERNMPELLNLLLESKKNDVNARDDEGNTALILASIHHDNAVVINKLLDAGADRTLINKRGCNAHMEARRVQHRAITPLLKQTPYTQEEFKQFLLWRQESVKEPKTCLNTTLPISRQTM